MSMRLIDFTKAYDSVHRTLLERVLPCLLVPRLPRISRRYASVDDREGSDMFDVDQGIEQECELATSLFYTSVSTMLCVGE